MTARAAKPGKAVPLDPLDEAKWDRLLPPIDEKDPEWQAYVRSKVQESLDDPRPSISGDEVLDRIRQRHEARLKRGL